VHVDGRQVNIPSFLVKPGKQISLPESSRTFKVIAANLETASGAERLPWLEWNPENFTGRLLSVPSREDIPTTVNEQLIVELYSK
jgi:small subunit ribosomal protein S4